MKNKKAASDKNNHKMNRNIIIITSAIFVFIIVSLFIVFFTTISKTHDFDIVASVNGEDICVKEFRQQLVTNFSADTYYYFSNKYGAEDTKDFWTQNFNGEIPIDRARKKALDKCVDIKIQQILAKQKNIIEDISYEYFWDDLKKENIRRKDAIKKSQVIYGPTQYGENEYFSYVFSNMQVKLKEMLAEDELIANEDFLKEYYNQIKDSFYKRPDSIKTEKISLVFLDEKGNHTNILKEHAKKKIQEAKERLDKGETFEDVAKSINVEGRVIEQVFDEESARMDSRFYEMLKLEAMKLKKGEMTGIVVDRGAFSIAKCIEKIKTDYYMYDEVKDNVKIKYIDKVYAEFLDKQKKDADIQINQKVYSKVFVR